MLESNKERYVNDILIQMFALNGTQSRTFKFPHRIVAKLHPNTHH